MFKVILLIFAFAIHFPNLHLLSAWTIQPAIYEVSIENGLSNGTLWVHCKSRDSDLGLHMIPRNDKFAWAFKTSLWKQKLYFCGLTWDHYGRKVFDAFIDDLDFEDDKCGGRHCLWKALDDGIYLYHIKQQQLRKMYKWNKYQYQIIT